jgi:uncharacterized protein (DUF1501 family)
VAQVNTQNVSINTGESRGVNRDSFAISLGGFDTHFDLKSVLQEKFQEIGPVLKGFRDALVELGLWDSVTVVVSSEFGRTVTPNTSAGTDHGWGGHHIIMGGKVRATDLFAHRLLVCLQLNYRRGNHLAQWWQDHWSSPTDL